MKQILFIFIFLLGLMSPLATLAQGNKDKVEEMRMNFITKKLELSTQEAEKFWPVYNEYNDKVKALRKTLRQSLRKAPETLSEKEAEELYQLDIKTKTAEAELHRQYSERIKAIIGARKTVMLRTAEEEFRQKVLETLKGS